jgi:hypothetical protein
MNDDLAVVGSDKLPTVSIPPDSSSSNASYIWKQLLPSPVDAWNLQQVLKHVIAGVVLT